MAEEQLLQIFTECTSSTNKNYVGLVTVQCVRQSQICLTPDMSDKIARFVRQIHVMSDEIARYVRQIQICPTKKPDLSDKFTLCPTK